MRWQGDKASEPSKKALCEDTPERMAFMRSNAVAAVSALRSASAARRMAIGLRPVDVSER
jgi:hypothetical protein